MINDRAIRQWWDIFRRESPLTEIRVLAGRTNYSGYYTDCESALEAIRQYDGFGIYSPINAIKGSCYGRTQHDKMVQSPKSTTNDNDIEGRRWILIDLDPTRPSDTNSSDEEKKAALDKARQVFRFLRAEGFNEPVIADSGNGYHLYYRVDLPNTAQSTELVKTFLAALDALLSDDLVKVDTSVFNASRIVKVIGTSSNKGANTADRPQRVSGFVLVPDPIVPTPDAYVLKVAGYYPKPEEPSRFNGYSSERFDLDGFIASHGIEVVSRSRFAGGEKIVLKECPFDSNHKNSAILHLDSGAIAFKCFHNSCSHYTWKDFRIHFDPQAYSRRDNEEYRFKRSYYGRRDPQPIQPVEEDARGKKWLSMAEINWVDPSTIIHIPSGIEKIDKTIGGFALGDVSIISGLSGAGKTTVLDTFILSAVQRGFKVAAWSGELQDFRYQSWLDQIAAGRGYVKKKAGYTDLYYCPKIIAEKINKWLDGKLWLYNNAYGNEWTGLRSDIEEIVEKEGVELVLLDNLMALDMDAPSDNDAQTSLIKSLKNLAKSRNIHIMLVCHPRKEQSFQLLRKESIAGTANLTNLCDNLFIIHRVGKDFEKRAKEFWGEDVVAECLGYDVVLEIAKNRSMGVVDTMARLYYEKETRRILNDRDENMIYGWNEDPTPVPMFPDAGDIPDVAWDEHKEKEIQRWWDK